MSKAQSFDKLWPIPEHTKVKHQILRDYLNAWLAIISKSGISHSLAYIDGFAGPGEYEGGEPGSPIIALNAFLGHKYLDRSADFWFLFNEGDRDRMAHLKAKVAKLDLPENCKIFYSPYEPSDKKDDGDFDKAANQILEIFEERPDIPVPSLWFIDPFGYSQVPMELMARISRWPRSEVLFHMMTNYVKRALGNLELMRTNLVRVFGCMNFEDEISSTTHAHELADYYIKRLRQCTDFRYFLQFALRPVKGNWHHLIFATCHPKGFVEMKKAMWRANHNGDFRYEARDPKTGEQLEFAMQPDVSQLRARLRAQFGSRASVTIETVREFVDNETLFVAESHLKRKTLVPMETDGDLEYLNPPRKGKQKTFVDGCSFKIR